MRNPKFFFRYLTVKFKLTHFNQLEKILRSETEASVVPIKVLDLGAGSASYWRIQPLRKFIDEGKIEVTVVDANDKILHSHVLQSIRYIIGYVPEVLASIRTNDFDWVCAFDLIEHLSKEDGYRLLYEIDRIADKGSMIFTPNGFVWQPSAVNNPFNAHISGWKPSELKELSWSEQRGYVGMKIMHGPYGKSRYHGKSAVILELLALIQIVIFFVPTFSFAFSAVKRGKNSRIDKQE